MVPTQGHIALVLAPYHQSGLRATLRYPHIVSTLRQETVDEEVMPRDSYATVGLPTVFPTGFAAMIHLLGSEPGGSDVGLQASVQLQHDTLSPEKWSCALTRETLTEATMVVQLESGNESGTMRAPHASRIPFQR